MKVLWLGISDDVSPHVPEESRTSTVATRTLEDAIGEPVEVTLRAIWPTEHLPGLVSQWLERYRPDLVYLTVGGFWFTYESVPVKLRHRLGPLGRPIATAGLKAAEGPWVAYNPAFRGLRRLALRTIGGETHFTAEEVVERISEVVRRVLAWEEAILIVRGPALAHDALGTEQGYLRAEALRRQVTADLRRLCDRLHVTFAGVDDVARFSPDSPDFYDDGVHVNADIQRRRGEEQGRILVEAWGRAHPGSILTARAAADPQRSSPA